MRILGCDFETNNLRLLTWFDNAPDFSAAAFEQAFPGFVSACFSAVKEIQMRQLPVEKLTYLRGEIRAYTSVHYGAASSEPIHFILQTKVPA